jgi:hypothetical protein
MFGVHCCPNSFYNRILKKINMSKIILNIVEIVNPVALGVAGGPIMAIPRVPELIMKYKSLSIIIRRARLYLSIRGKHGRKNSNH